MSQRKAEEACEQNVDDISPLQVALQIAEESIWRAFSRYALDPGEHYRIEPLLQNGYNVFKVYRTYDPDPPFGYPIPVERMYQEIWIQDGILVYVEDHDRRNSYRYDPKTNNIATRSVNRIPQEENYEHHIEVSINDFGATMEENTDINGDTTIRADYIPVIANGKTKEIDFVPYRLWISDNLPLTGDDRSRILPCGRTVPLRTLIESSVDPALFQDEYPYEGVSPIFNVSGFPPLGTWVTDDHSAGYLCLPGRALTNDGPLGVAHPLARRLHNYDSWLVFVTIDDDVERAAHTMIVDVDPTSIRPYRKIAQPAVELSIAINGEHQTVYLYVEDISPAGLSKMRLPYWANPEWYNRILTYAMKQLIQQKYPRFFTC